jgi:class 3 adenylate cyclase
VLGTQSIQDAALEGMGETLDNGPFQGLRVRMGIHTGEPICQEDPLTGLFCLLR